MCTSLSHSLCIGIYDIYSPLWERPEMVSKHIYIYMYILRFCDVLMKTNFSIYALYVYVYTPISIPLSYICVYTNVNNVCRCT